MKRGVGVDLGSAAVKVVVVDDGGEIVASLVEPSDPRYEAQAQRMLDTLAVGDSPIVATGYGRKLLARAQRAVTEITCHAKGMFRLYGCAGTIVDIGGQDSKVIALGDDGEIKQFLMNDKCAAGTGRFLEVTAARLRLDLESLGRIALESPNEVTVSSTCTVFAESEIVSLLARGEAVEAIVRGLHRAMVKRVASLVRSIKPQPPLLFSGGVVRNEAVRQLLCETLKIEGRPPKHPQIAGAYGAALIAVG